MASDCEREVWPGLPSVKSLYLNPINTKLTEVSTRAVLSTQLQQPLPALTRRGDPSDSIRLGGEHLTSPENLSNNSDLPITCLTCQVAHQSLHQKLGKRSPRRHRSVIGPTRSTRAPKFPSPRRDVTKRGAVSSRNRVSTLSLVAMSGAMLNKTESRVARSLDAKAFPKAAQ